MQKSADKEKIRSASQGRIPLLVHYSFCSVTNCVKSLQEELKQALFHLLTEYFIIYFLTRPNYLGGSSDTHKIWSNKTKRNAALIFRIIRKCCFNKFTGEHNTKKYFKNFSFCESISLKVTIFSHYSYAPSALCPYCYIFILTHLFQVFSGTCKGIG